MPKKILFIIPLPPPVHGVSIMSEFAFHSKLIRSDFECAVLPLQFTNTLGEIGKFDFKKLWRMATFCIRLMIKLIRFQPDLVYFTLSPVGSAFYRDALFSFILRIFGVKRLFHLHGKGIGEEAASSKLKKALYRKTFNNSWVIILASSLEQDISSVYSGTPFILPNGIPYANSRESKSVNQVPSFLYLSNLVRTKGIEIFLNGIQKLSEKNIPFKARIVGAPYDVSLDELNTFMDKHKLTNTTEILGPLYGKAKEEVLSQSDILVFPTFYKNEAFPLSILEAMRSGLAVIASNNGAISEMVEEGKTGFVVPMQDTDATIAKMERLAKDNLLREEMGSRGREKFEQCYTIEIFEHRLFEIFKQVLK